MVQKGDQEEVEESKILKWKYSYINDLKNKFK